MNNIYLELTRKFNHGRVRAILAGGQAVVLHRLAIMTGCPEDGHDRATRRVSQ
jgi:hypothetical protein